MGNNGILSDEDRAMLDWLIHASDAEIIAQFSAVDKALFRSGDVD